MAIFFVFPLQDKALSRPTVCLRCWYLPIPSLNVSTTHITRRNVLPMQAMIQVSRYRSGGNHSKSWLFFFRIVDVDVKSVK